MYIILLLLNPDRQVRHPIECLNFEKVVQSNKHSNIYQFFYKKHFLKK